MKFNSVLPVKYKGTRYDFTIVDLPGGGVLREYQPAEIIHFTLATQSGTTLLLFGENDELYEKYTRIVDITDINGTRVGNAEGMQIAQWEVRNIIPVLTPWGVIERQAMQCVRI